MLILYTVLLFFFPHSYVEEDVDYNSGNDGLYARVNKAKSDNNFNTPTSGGPFVVHQVYIAYLPNFFFQFHSNIKLVQLLHP